MNIRQGNIEKVFTFREKVESRSPAAASYQAFLGSTKQKLAISDRSVNIRPGNIEKVLTSREKVESHRAVTVSYQASLSHRKTFWL